MIGKKTKHSETVIYVTDRIRLYTEFQNTTLYSIGSVWYYDLDDIEMILFPKNSYIWV